MKVIRPSEKQNTDWVDVRYTYDEIINEEGVYCPIGHGEQIYVIVLFNSSDQRSILYYNPTLEEIEPIEEDAFCNDMFKKKSAHIVFDIIPEG